MGNHRRQRNSEPIGGFVIMSIILIAACLLLYAVRSGRISSISELAGRLTGKSDPEYIEAQLYDKIYWGLRGHEESIDLGMLPGTEYKDTIADIYDRVLLEHPEVFWLDGEATIRGLSSAIGFKVTLTVKTHYDKAAIARMERELDAAALYITGEANSRCASDYEKALYIHDCIIRSCEYDEAAALDHTVTGRVRDVLPFSAYGCLVNGEAVCQGYSKAYMLLLQRLGIECGYISGVAEDDEHMSGEHSWNYFKLEDGYYLTDVTWDDPVGYDGGECLRTYFCVPEKVMLQDHTADESCTVPGPFGSMYLNG